MKYSAPIAIAVLILLSGFLYTEIRKLKAESDRKDTIIAEKTDSVRHWKTESGRQAIEKTAAIATAKEFKEAYPKFAEELKKEFDVKVKDLKAFVRAEFQARGEGTGSISNTYYVDSTGQRYKEFTMDDGYLKFRTTLFDSLTMAPYQYTYGDTLTYGFRTKKKWFLGNEKLYGFGGLKNPQAKIINATNVLIDDYKDKRFVVGPYVGYSISGNRVDFGVSLTYAIWKF